MNRRVAAHRAGYRVPRRYSVPMVSAYTDRLRALAFGNHTCFVIVLPPMDRAS